MKTELERYHNLMMKRGNRGQLGVFGDWREKREKRKDSRFLTEVCLMVIDGLARAWLAFPRIYILALPSTLSPQQQYNLLPALTSLSTLPYALYVSSCFI